MSALVQYSHSSTQFPAILVDAQFLFLPLCHVICIWSLLVNIILKIRNRVFEDNAVFYTEETKIFFELHLHFKKKEMISTLID